MLTLAKPNNSVIKILGRNGVDASREYRLSSYVYSYSEPGRHLIKSTMTGGIYSLSDEEWCVLDPALNPVVSVAVIEDKGLSDLVFEWVMVYSSDDDYSRYKLAVSILKAMISAVIARSCMNARHLYATVVLTGAIIAANSRSWIQMRS